MFPMNFNLPATHQYQQSYQQQNQSSNGYQQFQYGNIYYQQQP